MRRARWKRWEWRGFLKEKKEVEREKEGERERGGEVCEGTERGRCERKERG